MPSTQSQQQQYPPQPSATGAKTTYLMTKVSNLSHCRLTLRCSCSGDYAVAPVQCHVSNVLHAALHRGPAQHAQSHTTYHPYEPPDKCQHAYICKMHTIHMHIHTIMHANSKICTTEYCADAVQTARNSASGWNQTSSSCPCSCAPLHHTGSQQCHAMLPGM